MTRYPEVRIEKVREGKPTWWRVTEPVLCRDLDGSTYVIPAGFVSNFASMTRWLYPFFPPHGLSAIPSVKHDYRYIHLVGVPRQGFWKARVAADRQYRQDLMAEGMPATCAWLMWAGVRALGWLPWLRHFIKRAKELFNTQ